jgi:hypothetical protein
MDCPDQTFLVLHDYGTGGLWWWITAGSAEEILDFNRDVEIFERPPHWWNQEMDRNVPRLRLGDARPGLSGLAKDS